MKPNISPQIKTQILAITKGKRTPFFLRKKKNCRALEMVFYTKPKFMKVGNSFVSGINRVTIGYPEGLHSGCYYHIDDRMEVTPFGNRHHKAKA